MRAIVARTPDALGRSMAFVLHDAIHFCISGEQVILLDVRSERFCALPRSCNDAFLSWLGGEPIAEREMSCLELLVVKGILHRTAQEAPRPDRRTPVRLVSTDLLDTSLLQPSTLEVVRAISARLLWAWRMKHWRLERQLQHLEQPVGSKKTTPTADVRAIARAFELADRILGSHDKCMERSFAMLSVCRKYGLPARAVIGVQNGPFAAHCWVQDGEIVLNEHPDRVQLFTPIMVI